MYTIARTLILFSLVCFASAGASARTFEVLVNIDSNDLLPGDGLCSDVAGECTLRAAISEANEWPGDDTIILPAGAYTHSIDATTENSNAAGDWDISSNITIIGAGRDTTILQAGANYNEASERVLEVLFGGSLTLKDVTVRYGRTYVPMGTVSGAGIQNGGTLSLDNVMVRDNNAVTMTGIGLGGGIYSTGVSLTLNNTTVTANRVTGAFTGGGIGGGVASTTSSPSTIVITDSSISGNSVQGVVSAASGGGLYVSGIFDLTATGSHFDSNSLLGEQASEGAGARLISYTNPSFFNFTNCTFNGSAVRSTASGALGAGLSLSTNNSTLTGKLDRVSINGNHALGTGVSRGGGLYVNPVTSPLSLEVVNSSISQNINDGSLGGGVEISNRDAPALAFSTVSFRNTTISGNSAGAGSGSGGKGGGIHVEASSAVSMDVFLNFVTVTNNSATTSGGGILNAPGQSSVDLSNSIITGNSAGTSGQDISGSITSQDYNHIKDLTGASFTPGAHDTSGFDPQLGVLQNNGGPTLSHLLAATSPLLDTIPQGVGGCGVQVTTDQRLLTRPFGAGCDKGSTESHALAFGPWNLSGTVKTTTGIPIRNVAVTVSGGDLPAPITVFTGNLGTYQFTNLPGAEYTIIVTAKRYHINDAIVVLPLGANITDADFIANAPFTRDGLEMVNIPQAKKGK
jgi:Carboxypeptidase regulatory-like domain